MDTSVLNDKRELFKKDIDEVANFMYTFAGDPDALLLAISYLSKDEIWDDQGLKYLIGLFYAASIMIEETEERTFTRVIEEMLKLENRLRASKEEAEAIISDKLN